MNANELAMLMLEYADLVRRAEELGGIIRDAVLKSGKTLVTGTVRATYSGGRRTVDYRSACGRTDKELVDQYPAFCDWKIIVKYKDIAEIENLDLEPFTTKSEPSVTLKLEAEAQ